VLLPACDFSGQSCPYIKYDVTQRVTLTATSTGYQSPVYSWTVGGQPATNGTMNVSAAVTYPKPGGDTDDRTDTVPLQVTLNGNSITVVNDSVLGAFDMQIAVSVDEDSTTAVPAQNGARRAGVVAPFVGCSIDEPDYDDAVKRCQKAADDLWVKTHKQHVPIPGPIDPGPLRDLEHVQHAWAMPAQRVDVRRALVTADQLESIDRRAGESLRTISVGVARRPALRGRGGARSDGKRNGRPSA
jgi:hypothetical protein